ncbi:MAG: catalase, partial [Moraxellaceae bacterium]
MHGFSSHTLSFWNDKGERVWIKWHFKTNQGIKTLKAEETYGLPPFGAQQDLISSIDNGDFPSWTVKLQVMTEQQAVDYKINPFDLTKVWPHGDFPLVEIGQLELNRNVQNYFAETEQATFAPSNLIPGVGASPDKMLQARLLAYQDAHRYRVGVNANQLPVNAPRCPVNHYQRDGAMAGCPFHNGNVQGGGANFYPNDRAAQGAPVPTPAVAEPPLHVSPAAIQVYDQSDADYHSQAGDLFRLMTDDQKQQLAGNIAGGLSQADASVQERMLAQMAKADLDYAARVKALL